MKKLILTHANCVDGCCCRAILEQKFGKEADYIEVDYADFNPDIPVRYEKFKAETESYNNTEVIMADICLSEEFIEMFLKNKNKVTIIDHHKTVIPLMNKLREKLKDNPDLPLHLIFSDNNDVCGAKMTWLEYGSHKEIPKMIDIVEDYDLWQFKFEETAFFHAALLENGMQPKDIEKSYWVELLNNPELFEAKTKSGESIYKDYMKLLKEYSYTAKEVVLDGHKGLMVNAPLKYRSDLGNIVAEQSGTFAMIWEKTEDGIVSCSLRSKPGFDVSVIAEKFKGGGHTNAAAFRVNDENTFHTLIVNELKNFLTEKSIINKKPSQGS